MSLRLPKIQMNFYSFVDAICHILQFISDTVQSVSLKFLFHPRPVIMANNSFVNKIYFQEENCVKDHMNKHSDFESDFQYFDWRISFEFSPLHNILSLGWVNRSLLSIENTQDFLVSLTVACPVFQRGRLKTNGVCCKLKPNAVSLRLSS